VPTGSHVVRATDEALITVEKHITGDPLDGGSESRVWRGCSEHRGELVELERAEAGFVFASGRSVRSFRLAGPVVGCLVEDGDRYEAETHLTVVRLDSGERWSSDPENRQIGSLTGFTEIAVDRLATPLGSARATTAAVTASGGSSCAVQARFHCGTDPGTS